MTIEAQPAEPSDALSREAAEWFARMRGPETEAVRPRFEAWLASDATHRSAYNRAAEIFAMGKILAEDEETPTRRRSRMLTPALATCALAAIVTGGWTMLRSPEPARPPTQIAASDAQPATHATTPGETRSIRLADGSTLTLGSDSAVETAFDPGRRQLRLLRGQARFAVAHELRPFIVLAGGGSVTARGTVFEVTLAAADRVDVRLLEGAIDVALPRRNRSVPVVRRLSAGERLSFAVPPANGSPPPSPAPVGVAATAPRDYQGVTVAALIAEANRGAARPIRLADPALGAKRVSGRFRIDDTELLADRLAVLFDGKAELGDEREIVLAR